MSRERVHFMAVLFFRTLVLYILVVAALRVMGKRQLGELQPSELVVAIMISDLAAIPIEERSTSMLEGVVPILTLVVMELIFSVLVIKSEFFRSVLTGRPALIIKNGKIQQGVLRRLRLSIDDLLEQLRLMGYSDISEVNTVLLETNGQISVIPREISRPATPKDLGLTPTQTHLPHTVIADGKLRQSGLEAANITEERVMELLKKKKIRSTKDVFYMNVTDDGGVFIEPKDKTR